jgi:pimeloyl-ACP methyl ester carboxylesterase
VIPLALIAVALSLVAAAAWAQDRLVRLPDHRRIHLACSGGGKVTAILEAGFGAGADAWYKVQPELAQTMRVCAYDRAGAGKSDPGPFPRDGAAIAQDLDQALRAANIKGPFIGVGHSSGALYIRLFAARRPGEMKGLVLVDPSVEHQTTRLDRMYGPGAGSVEGIRQGALACEHFVETPPLAKADPLYKRCISTDPDERAWSLNPMKWKTQVSEIETLFTTTSDQVDAGAAAVRNVPTIILTAEEGGEPQRRLHAELKAQFAHAEQRQIPSGHMMIFDRPQAIIEAANELAR